MDKVLYLVHTTQNNPEKYTELRRSHYVNHQFPGVYFSIITTNNLNIEEIFENRYIMIFSPNLLKQKNYHINIRDYNGFITETNTYYPWNLNEAIKKIEEYSNDPTAEWHSNEVVFHDDVPIKYLCQTIKKTKDFSLPKTRCENKEEPDLTKLPFYAYSFENKYTGRDPLIPSSNAFYRKMARLAKLDPIPKSTDEIISALEEKAPYFFEHRNEQNINALKSIKRRNYTSKRTKSLTPRLRSLSTPKNTNK